MAGLVGALSSGNRYADVGDGLFHLVPNQQTAAADGFDWNDVFWYGADDQLPGTIGEPLADVAAQPPPPPSSGPPPPPSSGSPPPSAGASSFSWGERTWHAGELAAFIAYLGAHGVDYSSWAANHPAAAAILEGPPTDPNREPLPKSLGEALYAYVSAGASAADAAAQAEALRRALVAEGVSAVTSEQLLADAESVFETFHAEQGQPPPTGEPDTGSGDGSGGRTLQSVDKSQRDRADTSGLPPIPFGFKPIANGQVTEALIVSAALIEHADLWITLGTCKQESGFNLEEQANSANAVGPMQVVGYPTYDGSPPLVEWAWGNLIAGARILAKLGAIYDDDQQKMSAAYNAGQGAVNAHWPKVLQWLEVPGHPEDGNVQGYVDAVARFADVYRRRFASGWNIDPQTGNLIGGSTTSSPPPPTPGAKRPPAGVNAQWMNLMEAIGTTSPKRHDQLQSQADALTNVFR